MRGVVGVGKKVFPRDIPPSLPRGPSRGLHDCACSSFPETVGLCILYLLGTSWNSNDVHSSISLIREGTYPKTPQKHTKTFNILDRYIRARTGAFWPAGHAHVPSYSATEGNTRANPRFMQVAALQRRLTSNKSRSFNCPKAGSQKMAATVTPGVHPLCDGRMPGYPDAAASESYITEACQC